VLTGAADIRILRSLISATEQQDHPSSGNRVIDSVSRANIDAQLPYPIAATPVIAEVAEFHSVDSTVNCDPCLRVAELMTPFHEEVVLALRHVVANLVHELIIVYKRRIVKLLCVEEPTPR
jgi:hypothetical protein